MDVVKRWWLRLTAATLATVTMWMLPAAAWADSHPNMVAIGTEVARRRPRSSGFGRVIGACCCLVVVVVIVVVVLLMRRRRQPPPPTQFPQ
jgi:hypothetical protein